jgi:hypothetical protein
MDDLGAAVAVPALGHVGYRQCTIEEAAGSAVVFAVAVRTLAWR